MGKSIALIAVLACAGICAPDWLTFGGDPQRTGSAGSRSLLNRDSARKLKLLWTTPLDSVPVELNSITAPVVVTHSGPSGGSEEIAIVGTSDDQIFAFASVTGRMIWRRKFDAEGLPLNGGKGGWICPNVLQATPVIDPARSAVYAISRDGRLHTLNYLTGDDQHPPFPFVPPFSRNWSLNLFNGVLYTSTSQSCNRAENGVWAVDLNAPRPQPAHWRSAGGIWGSAGVAVGFDGRIFATVGDGGSDVTAGRLADAVVALKPRRLDLADYFIPSNAVSMDRRDLDLGSASPSVFRFRQWELVAAAGKEGAIWLLDTKSLGGRDHRTPLFHTPLYANEDEDFAGRGFWGALAVVQDSAGAPWLLAPAWGPQSSLSPRFPFTHGDAPDGSLMAFQVQVKDGKPALVPVWRSGNMKAPAPAVFAEGVIFTLESGEDTRQVDSGGNVLSSKDRAEASTHATLYALDAATGDEIYSSGDAIHGFTHFGGMALSGGKVFVAAGDGKHAPAVYAFGLREEQ